jgi:hypothetical protein
MIPLSVGPSPGYTGSGLSLDSDSAETFVEEIEQRGER